MHCYVDLVRFISYGMILAGLGHLIFHNRSQRSYGRHRRLAYTMTIPAKVAWFLQEMPSLMIPLFLIFSSHKSSTVGKYLLLGTFCLHYFQRTFVYSLLTRGKPFPLGVMVGAGFFCSVNGFLQGHYLLHCGQYDNKWLTGYHLKTGLLLFYIGMAINIHNDYILRNLRKPNEADYKIPRGGLFEYVSGANYLGEIVEWFGYALATWSFPALSFALFSLCFIGPRACYHHRFYQEKFNDYPKFRKALIPFIF
ncbi:3-oxo-5-alpha-steroid 4-dehydrogenase 2b [Pholidichthys leucotaenia]